MVVEVQHRVCFAMTPTHSETQGEKLFRSFDVSDENDVYDSLN